MNILITGATGFLGSHLTEALLAQGHEPYMMGRDFSTVTPLIARGARALPIDLRNRAAVIAACQGIDLIYHVGALSSAWGDPTEFYRINVDGTKAIVDGAKQHGVARLVHVSSPAVVFNGRDQVNITEAAPYPKHFTSAYAETKKLAEDVVNEANAQGLETVILRPKAIFGPGDRSLLPRLIDRAKEYRLPQIGHGDNLVDLTYVDNVVQALMLAAAASRASGKTYFITNNEHIPLWLTIRYVLHRLHLSTNLRTVSLPTARAVAWLLEQQARLTGNEPSLTRYTVGILGCTQTYDISAAQRELGYQPCYTVVEGIERTLASLGANANDTAVHPLLGRSIAMEFNR